MADDDGLPELDGVGEDPSGAGGGTGADVESIS